MCTPDGECTETEPVCETVSYSTCTRAPCASDADCPSRMACHADRYLICDGGMAGSGVGGSFGAAGAMAAPCDPAAGPCEEPPLAVEPDCHEETGQAVCTPRHELPCEVASDCGGGFDCVPSSHWVCTGMGGAGSGAGGAAGAVGGPTDPPADDPADDRDAGSEGDFECHEEPSGVSYCQLQELPCGSDADCPDGLLCQDQYIYQPCVGGRAGAAAGAGAAVGGAGGSASGFDGGMAPPPDSGGFECPPPVVEQRCLPPEYNGGSGGMGSPPPSGGSNGSADGGVSDPETPGGAAGAAGSTSGPGAGGQGGAGGSSSGGEDDDSGHGDGRGHHFGWLLGGCSAASPISADLSWLVFGLVALVLRRRQRRHT
jgi:uncharacterized protein (TIGR03382 family)